MKITFCISLVLLSLVTNILFAKTEANGARFTLHPDNAQEFPDSVSVTYFRGTIYADHGRTVLKAELNSGRAFTFVIPNEQHIIPFQILAYYPGGKHKWSDIYYAETSDDISAMFRRTEFGITAKKGLILNFSGNGAAKFLVKDLLVKNQETLHAKENKRIKELFGIDNELNRNNPISKLNSSNYYESQEFKDYLTDLYQSVLLSVKEGEMILAQNKRNLSSDMAIYYQHELNSYHSFRFFVNYLYNRTSVPNLKRSLRDFYFLKIPTLKPRDPENSLVKYSEAYVVKKNNEIAMELRFRFDGNRYPFHKLYDIIKATNNQEIREVLITELFTRPALLGYTLNDSKDSCFNDALNRISNPKLIEMLKRELLFAKGRNVYDFSFLDTAGIRVGLKDMKGKVFIIDFYGTGCGPCAFFAKRFEDEIYPEFAHNKSFSVINVSIDKNRSTWVKAIKSGKYTQKSSINLNAGELSWNHPMLRYYHVKSIPFVLLVDDDGRIISVLYAQSSSEISAMIRTALNKLIN